MKKQLREWLIDRRLDLIVERVTHRRRVLGTLTTLTYDADPLVVWRAVEAVGQAAGRVAETDPEFVREHLRRLFWLLTDESGGIAWHAPEAIGEIIRSQPALFADMIPLLLALLEMDPEDLVRFLPGTLWAIGRVGQVMPEAVGPARARILFALQWADSQARGMAVWCSRQLGQPIPKAKLAVLLEDDGAVALYVDGHITNTTVRQLAEGWGG